MDSKLFDSTLKQLGQWLQTPQHTWWRPNPHTACDNPRPPYCKKSRLISLQAMNTKGTVHVSCRVCKQHTVIPRTLLNRLTELHDK